MDGWTISRVCDRAENELAYYQEKEPESAVRNAVVSILSDLNKFDAGRTMLSGLDKREMLRIAAESDDTALQKLIKSLRSS